MGERFQDRRMVRIAAKLLLASAIALLLGLMLSQTARAATLSEYSGADRYETAGLIDDSFQDVVGGSHSAILVCGTNFPDALVASSLAGLSNCPILLTMPDELSGAAEQHLADDVVTQVYIIGGTPSVSEDVEDQVTTIVEANRVKTGSSSETDSVVRIAGDSRYQTACRVLEGYTGRWGDTLIVSTGKSFPDSASISPLAFSKHYPILLAQDDGTLDATTEATLTTALSSGVFSRVIITGSSASVNDDVASLCANLLGYSSVSAAGDKVVRLGGYDRFNTSALIAAWCVSNGYLSYSNMALASGGSFADALSGGALQGASGSVTMLVGENASGKSAYRTLLGNGTLSAVRIFGGTPSVSSYIRTELTTGVIDYVEVGQAAAAYCLAAVGSRYSQDYRWEEGVYDCSSLAYRAYSETGSQTWFDIAAASSGWRSSSKDNNGTIRYCAANEAEWCVDTGRTISVDELRPGDWIFFGGADTERYRGIYHVAIYVGGGMVVQAAGDDEGVILSNFTQSNIGLYGRPYQA